jgi:hypothetical protein
MMEREKIMINTSINLLKCQDKERKRRPKRREKRRNTGNRKEAKRDSSKIIPSLTKSSSARGKIGQELNPRPIKLKAL